MLEDEEPWRVKNKITSICDALGVRTNNSKQLRARALDLHYKLSRRVAEGEQSWYGK